MFVEQLLYGGKISTVIPQGFLDASEVREVPDTQEVFVNNRDAPGADGLGTNESVIVDLLERADEDDAAALRTHLEDIALRNSSGAWQVVRCERAGTQTTCVVVEPVLKWGQAARAETLVLCFGLLRLPQVATDVAISVNCPVAGEELAEMERYAAAAAAGAAPEMPARVEACYRLLRSMVGEFKLLDESLFVQS
ncbi:AaceriAFR434Wp [[Ashbya] aceris (nom. inval.)]|nr:AaceriAFR434Wp [[Ashbya] aceris (nom. inval.)]